MDLELEPPRRPVLPPQIPSGLATLIEVSCTIVTREASAIHK